MSKSRTNYWTRKLELDLVQFVKEREFIWRPVGNTNYDIQKKYKAYAEFAAILDRGFTARSVRDRWVNIRCTFNHYLRRIERSINKEENSDQIYVPCWPLWKPLQFLRDNSSKNNEVYYANLPPSQSDEPFKDMQNYNTMKHEKLSDRVEIEEFDVQQNNSRTDSEQKEQSSTKRIEMMKKFNKLKQEDTSNMEEIEIRQEKNSQQINNLRTDRPRHRKKIILSSKKKRTSQCVQVLDDLVTALKPMLQVLPQESHRQSYWFFGKHVTERLNSMTSDNGERASSEILKLIGENEEDDIA